MKNLILIAAPGAGKGTLSNDILEKYDYVHISTGDLLREQVAKGDELGKEIEKVQAAGGLVSNEIVYKALENKLNDPKCDNGYILDGFPRNLEQAKEYDNILKRTKRFKLSRHENIQQSTTNITNRIKLKRLFWRLLL